MVFSFLGDYRASSFRTPFPSKEFLECMEQLCKEEPLTWSTTAKGKRKPLDSKQSKKNLLMERQEADRKVEEELKEEEARLKMSKEELRKLRKKQRNLEVGIMACLP